MRYTDIQNMEDNEDSDDFDEIQNDLKQGTTTDGTDLASMKLSPSEFVDFVRR